MIKTSTCVFTSTSSIAISSAGATQATTHVISERNVGCQSLRGSIHVTHDGVSLEATYHRGQEELYVFIRGFDLTDPRGTLVEQRLTLQPDERRVISIPRSGDRLTVRFIVLRVRDGLQILVDTGPA